MQGARQRRRRRARRLWLGRRAKASGSSPLKKGPQKPEAPGAAAGGFSYRGGTPGSPTGPLLATAGAGHAPLGPATGSAIHLFVLAASCLPPGNARLRRPRVVRPCLRSEADGERAAVALGGSRSVRRLRTRLHDCPRPPLVVRGSERRGLDHGLCRHRSCLGVVGGTRTLGGFQASFAAHSVDRDRADSGLRDRRGCRLRAVAWNDELVPGSVAGNPRHPRLRVTR